MKSHPLSDSHRDLIAENQRLREEIRVAREAAEITAELVVKQFEETERILYRFQTANAMRKAVLDSASQISIIATDIQGIITVMNAGAENLLGYSAKEVIGKKKPEFFHDPKELTLRSRELSEQCNRNVEAGDLLMAYAIQGRSEQGEWNYIRKDGTPFPVEMTINALKDPNSNEVNGFLCIAMDITVRKEAEEALLRTHEELEQRVLERTRDLARINEELEIEISERRTADQALRESEQQLEGIMNSITDRMSMIDENYTIVWANDIAKRVFGKGIIGKTCYRAYRRLTNPCHSCVAQKTFADGRIHEHETDAISVDGERLIYWCTTSVTAWHKDGRPRMVVENSRDITDRKRAEAALRASEEKYRSIFENATEGIFQSTPQGLLLTVNPAFVKILGYDSEAELIETVTSIRDQLYVEPERRDEFQKLMKQQDMMVRNFETPFFRKDKSIIHISLSAHAVRDQQGNVRYYEGILEDITQKRRAEDLKIGKDTAEAATQAKSDFLANMSHEIRTPLNAIIGLSDLAQKGQLTPKLKDYLSKINVSAHSLLGIINDILDFSKIEAGRMNFEQVKFDLFEVLDNISDMLSGRAAEKGIELVISVAGNVPTALIGDPLRLSQVLTNLTANSIKFTETGEVMIRVELLTRDKGNLRLRFIVKDSGIGIAEDTLPHLFDPFTQADGSTTRRYGGTGLGLAICKRLVEMMDGEITARSEIGKGSSFFFTGRFGIHQESIKIKHSLPEPLKGKRVLVVDDNAASREIIAEILTGFGFMTDVSESGFHAVEMMRSACGNRDYDLVIMDWMMPEMDGISALKHIRSDPLLGDIPVIIMTAFGREQVMTQARAAGVNGFLIKPIKQSLLLDNLMEIFGRPGPEEIAGLSSSEMENGKRLLEGIRLLLVEDNFINLQVASEILFDSGAQVATAENGKEALEKRFSGDHFDAVLMDVQMPEMDGLTATREIRRIETEKKLSRMPIIAMTAHAMKGDRERCIGAGMDDYVTKPIDNAALMKVLAHWVGRCCPEEPKFEPEPEPEGEGRGGAFPEPPLDIDFSKALCRLNGNEHLFEELLTSFVEKFKDAPNRIRKLLSRREVEKAGELIHALKGISGNLSAIELNRRCIAAEAELREKRQPDDELLEAFEETFQKMELAAAAYIESRESKVQQREEEAPAGDISEEILTQKELSDPIARLDQMLADNDLEAEAAFRVIYPKLKTLGLNCQISEILEQQQKCPEEAEPIIDRLAAQIRGLDFERARKTLEAVALKLNIDLAVE